MRSDRFDHLCDEPECCSYKQKTYARSCGCHKTRETMMLEHIARLESIPLARLLALDPDGRDVEVPFLHAAE